jgi:hypothetical protein
VSMDLPGKRAGTAVDTQGALRGIVENPQRRIDGASPSAAESCVAGITSGCSKSRKERSK